jgi:hypothetical protein
MYQRLLIVAAPPNVLAGQKISLKSLAHSYIDHYVKEIYLLSKFLPEYTYYHLLSLRKSQYKLLYSTKNSHKIDALRLNRLYNSAYCKAEQQSL